MPTSKIVSPTEWPTKVGDFANPLIVIQDFSKTVVTLATAVLAVTATFAGTLLGVHPSHLMVVLLLFSWLCLVSVFGLVFFITGDLTDFLRGIKPDTIRASKCCNLALPALVLAMGFLALIAVCRFWSETPQPDISATIATVAAMRSFPNVPAGLMPEATVEIIKWNEDTNTWTAEVITKWRDSTALRTQRVRLVLDSRGDRILAVNRVE